MKKLANRTSILIIIILFLAGIFSLESFKLTDFVNDYYTSIVGTAFFFTAIGWNITLLLDKRKE